MGLISQHRTVAMLQGFQGTLNWTLVIQRDSGFSRTAIRLIVTVSLVWLR